MKSYLTYILVKKVRGRNGFDAMSWWLRACRVWLWNSLNNEAKQYVQIIMLRFKL